MPFVVTDRAIQVVRQLKPEQRAKLMALIERATSLGPEKFLRENATYKIANPQRKVAYIRGPENLRIILSFAPDGTVLIEDVLSKQVLSKITGKNIQ